jgi:hypothetical protein
VTSVITKRPFEVPALLLEHAVAVAEAAVGGGRSGASPVCHVEAVERVEALGHFQPVGADVLDRRGADRAGDQRQVFQPRPALRQRPLHEVVPVLAGTGAHVPAHRVLGDQRPAGNRHVQHSPTPPCAARWPASASPCSPTRPRSPRDLTHSLDALAALPDLKLTAAFGPQHGLRGDKQDNMVESPDFLDPLLGIPVFSLYGEVRRPTAGDDGHFDVLLVDLQDLGCRIYTFITTLRYVLEAAAKHGKAVWVLDRPNPAGRPVEGCCCAGWESFVGAGPMPMRHGLTMGELGHWFIATLKLDVDCA